MKWVIMIIDLNRNRILLIFILKTASVNLVLNHAIFIYEDDLKIKTCFVSLILYHQFINFIQNILEA